MLYIKLYVILSILLVFNLFKESCAGLSGTAAVHSNSNRGGGGGSSVGSRRTFDSTGGKNSGIDLCSIDCEYLFILNLTYCTLYISLVSTFDVVIHILMHPKSHSILFNQVQSCLCSGVSH